ncbi:hypothetical protein SD71_05635 [Cohnella kolymensis]|uniref:SLH domain-containing protein n=1 Tax=Cohnella kolymensis TaxID=1590652 RepID=A0ABR5A7A9_9BACL|nr:Ig-like domain-containing protein [Cohnella kolymensis]KIL36876.1 hypothetical protein SD71_05635 [Cohnella kolymensis]
MRRTGLFLLALLLLFSIPFTATAATDLTTEQKFEVLKQKNIFTGFSDGSSRLYESMSREQLAAVLFRLMELPEQASFPSYNDVLRSRWSFQEVEAVTRARLMMGVKTRAFDPEGTVTVEQLAVILIRAYGLSESGGVFVSGKVSKWARSAVSAALEQGLIPRLNDYTEAATRGLLVEAAYAIYSENNTEPLRVRSVEALSSTALKVNLVTPVNNLDKNQFTLRDVYGNRLTIQQILLSADRVTVTLWTDRQIGGVAHTLFIDGTAWNYISFSEDTTKPQVQSFVSSPNGVITVVFSEAVDSRSATTAANYQINGLSIRNLQLSADNRTVTFTTSEQTHGKTYQLIVRNVKDLAGNTMDTRNDLYFTGNNDHAKPKVTFFKINADASLTVRFSEKLNPQSATSTGNYSIDKGLAVRQAVLDADGVTVTLRTSAQADATLYTLTVANVRDTAGNVMDASTHWFGGIANPETPVDLQSLRAIDQNTVEVTFSRAISDTDVGALRLTVLTDNGTAVSTANWQAFIQRKAGTNNVVTIQFRTTQSNPNLFQVSHVYLARVSGVVGLTTAGDKDEIAFAGTAVANTVPTVSNVVVLSRNSVKVQFSELVSIQPGAFVVNDATITSVVPDRATGPAKEVTLNFRDALTVGQTYKITFKAGFIRDAAGWNNLQTTDIDFKP